MRNCFFILFVAVVLFCSCQCVKETTETVEPVVEAVMEAPATAGWKVLFDGTSFEHWRGYKRDAFPEKGWVIDEGAMKVVAGGGGGDILTCDTFEDFDLRLEWKVSKGANSGIMYCVTEDENAPWKTGPEYQIYDDIAHGLEASSPVSSGALYDIYSPPAHKPMKPAGEWNEARIVRRGNMVEHWLNGIQVVECDLTSDDWNQRREKSKFHVYPGFGKHMRGHLCLQDHGNDVWFRNIRIRELPKYEHCKKISLFNGKDLSGWKTFTKKGEKPDPSTWTVKDGVLVCKGKPAGYIYTESDYKNFILKLQWRFSPETKKTGNSGVLMRITGPHEVWPRCVEAQLHSGNAGDFWCIGEFPMKTAPERTKGRNTKKTHFNENPAGEWNQYEIHVNRGNITLMVNGELLNHATDAEEIAGKIALQSEGVEIHFRNIELFLTEK